MVEISKSVQWRRHWPLSS